VGKHLRRQRKARAQSKTSPDLIIIITLYIITLYFGGVARIVRPRVNTK
jgi:hypothetical protein